MAETTGEMAVAGGAEAATMAVAGLGEPMAATMEKGGAAVGAAAEGEAEAAEKVARLA